MRLGWIRSRPLDTGPQSDPSVDVKRLTSLILNPELAGSGAATAVSRSAARRRPR